MIEQEVLQSMVNNSKDTNSPKNLHQVANEDAAARAEKKLPDDAKNVSYLSEMQELADKEAATKDNEVKKLAQQKQELADRIGQTTPTQDLVTDTDMLKALSEQAGIPFIEIADFPQPSLGVLKLIPSTAAQTYKVFPLRLKEDGTLVVAISNPLNITIIDDLRLLLDATIEPVIATEEDIVDHIDLYYGIGDETIEEMVEELEGEGEDVFTRDVGEVDLSDLEEISRQAPVIKLVNLLLLQSIKDRASDIHIEPFGGTLRIRYRVDGVLREIPSPPKSLQLGLCSRLKVMANMNISETRLPQDGRIKLTIAGREIDLRVSTLPTVHGEGIVMRVLDKSMMMMGIEQIGMDGSEGGMLEKFLKAIRKPNGIVLVTGPTGCGKTTTLYAGISEINDPSLKLITTEDPVEYQLDGLIQVNINEAVGLTYAGCLRSILRQDPDVILVGEIRDLETAQISIQASLTGHLVFSTLHTNSAAATITRLIDMNVEPFMIASTLEAIVGQRLVRTVCPNCRQPYTPNEEELADFGISPEEIKDVIFFKGEGCDECNHTGYKGRMGIFELMVMTDQIRECILDKATTDDIHELAVREGMRTMRQDGWAKICAGVTTFEEVTRQTPKESKKLIKLEMEQMMAEGKEKPQPMPETQPTGKQMDAWEKEAAKEVS